MKKIIFFDFAGPFFPGGCEQYLTLLAKHVSKKYHVTFMYSGFYVSLIEWIYFILLRYRPGSISFTIRNTVNIHLHDLSFWEFLPFGKVRYNTISQIKNANLIYAKNEFFELLFLYCVLGKVNFKRKVIVGVHSAIFIPSSVKTIWARIHNLLYFGWIYRTFLESCNLIHVVNKSYVEKISNLYGIKKAKIKCIPYFIDWKTNQIKNNQKQFTILWAGRLTRQKGIEELIKIIELISKMRFFKKIKILIAGDGEEKNMIINLVEKYKNVKYLGYVHKMMKIYQNVDLAIVTSNFETFGYNVLEPQSYGIPTISFDIDGPKQIIINNKTGYLVSSNEDFAIKIKYLVESKSHNEKLVSKASIFKTINSKFSKKNILNEMNYMFAKNLQN